MSGFCGRRSTQCGSITNRLHSAVHDVLYGTGLYYGTRAASHSTATNLQYSKLPTVCTYRPPTSIINLCQRRRPRAYYHRRQLHASMISKSQVRLSIILSALFDCPMLQRPLSITFRSRTVMRTYRHSSSALTSAGRHHHLNINAAYAMVIRVRGLGSEISGSQRQLPCDRRNITTDCINYCFSCP